MVPARSYRRTNLGSVANQSPGVQLSSAVFGPRVPGADRSRWAFSSGRTRVGRSAAWLLWGAECGGATLRSAPTGARTVVHLVTAFFFRLAHHHRLKKVKKSKEKEDSRANGNYFFFCPKKKNDDSKCKFASPVEMWQK